MPEIIEIWPEIMLRFGIIVAAGMGLARMPYAVEIGESKVTLSGLGSIDKRRTGLEIQKENQSYTLEVRYDFIGSYELSRRLREQVVDHFNNEILPVGFKAEDPSGGCFYGNKERYAWLIFLIIAVIYVMLAMTFESFRYPLPVIFMIPISFIGLFLVFGLTDFAIGTIAGMVFSVIAIMLVLPVFCIRIRQEPREAR